MTFSILRALSTPSRHLQGRQWELFHYSSRKKEGSFFSLFIFPFPFHLCCKVHFQFDLSLLSSWIYLCVTFLPQGCRPEATASICSAQPQFTQDWILGEGRGITSSLSWSCYFLLTVSFPWHPICTKSTEHHWAGQVPVQYSSRLLVNSSISQTTV